MQYVYSLFYFFHPSLAGVASGLLHLDLSNNCIRELPELYFEETHSLEFLDLSGNQLQQVPKLYDLEWTLTNLLLGRNLIENLNEIYNASLLTSLINIDLAFNNITEIDLQLINENCPKIKNIYVNNNIISTLSDTVELDNLTGTHFRLHAGNNPFICDDRIAWMMQPACTGYFSDALEVSHPVVVILIMRRAQTMLLQLIVLKMK